MMRSIVLWDTAGDVEIEWPARKVAAHLDHQFAEAEALRSTGWSVFIIERGLTAKAIEQALELGRGN